MKSYINIPIHIVRILKDNGYTVTKKIMTNCGRDSDIEWTIL